METEAAQTIRLQRETATEQAAGARKQAAEAREQFEFGQRVEAASQEQARREAERLLKRELMPHERAKDILRQFGVTQVGATFERQPQPTRAPGVGPGRTWTEEQATALDRLLGIRPERPVTPEEPLPQVFDKELRRIMRESLTPAGEVPEESQAFLSFVSRRRNILEEIYGKETAAAEKRREEAIERRRQTISARVGAAKKAEVPSAGTLQGQMGIARGVARVEPVPTFAAFLEARRPQERELFEREWGTERELIRRQAPRVAFR